MSADSSNPSRSHTVHSPGQPKTRNKAESRAHSSKPSSPRKIAANRQHSLQSTGPKSEWGKQNSKYNALKHGLLARQIVRISPECGESRQAFQKLLVGLGEELQPVGHLERVIVEKIALSIWRSKRAISFENGSIRQNVHAPCGPTPTLRLAPEEYRNFAVGYERLSRLLEDARSEFEATSQLQTKTAYVLRRCFPESPSLWTIPNGNEDLAEDAATWQSWKESVKSELFLLENEASLKRNAEERQFDIHYETSSIPSDQDLQRLQRYEAANDRQMYALLKQLHELQDRRRQASGGGERATG